MLVSLVRVTTRCRPPPPAFPSGSGRHLSTEEEMESSRESITSTTTTTTTTKCFVNKCCGSFWIRGSPDLTYILCRVTSSWSAADWLVGGHGGGVMKRGKARVTFCFLPVGTSPFRMLESMASMSLMTRPKSLSQKLNTSWEDGGGEEGEKGVRNGVRKGVRKKTHRCTGNVCLGVCVLVCLWAMVFIKNGLCDITSITVQRIQWSSVYPKFILRLSFLKRPKASGRQSAKARTQEAHPIITTEKSSYQTEQCCYGNKMATMRSAFFHSFLSFSAQNALWAAMFLHKRQTIWTRPCARSIFIYYP